MKALPHLLAVSLALGSLIGLIACSPSEPNASAGPSQVQARPQPVPFVEVVQSRSGALPLEQRLSGIVRARNEVLIRPEINGRIEAVLVDNGDFVEQGQHLVRLQSRQADEQLRQARANLEMQEATARQVQARLRESKAEFALTEQLALQDYISPRELIRLRAEVEIGEAEYDRALATVESARSTVEEQEWILSRTVIRSPITGQVGRRKAEVGMRVDNGSELFMVGDLSEVQVIVRLTEQMMNNIKVGQTALVHSDLFSDTLQAKVTRISPFLDPGSFSTEARIDLANPYGILRSGTYVDVDILYGEATATTLIPISAIVEDPRSGRFGVFVAPDADPHRAAATLEPGSRSEPTPLFFREVTVEARGREAIGIAGLDPGSWVVAIGHDLIEQRDVNAPPQEVRVRPIGWERLVSLQSLQYHDVLAQFMNRHRACSSGKPDVPAEGSRE